MEDKQIVELFWKRDENAISEAQNKYKNYCFSIARNILANQEDSEEIINDTFLAAWNSIPPHHPLILSTYLGKITRRLSLNRYRHYNAKKRGGQDITISLSELDECISDGRTIKEELEEKYLAESIDEFLAGLKEIDRKIFVCRYWYFDSIEEIANRFNFTQSKVKMNLKRNRDKLKDYLEKEGVIV